MSDHKILNHQQLSEIHQVLCRFKYDKCYKVDVYNISKVGKPITDNIYQNMIKHESQNFLVMVERIVQSGGDINYRLLVDNHESENSKIFGYTALHFAVKFQRTSIINFLINRNADFTIKDNNGYTPLHLAIKRSYEKNVNCLQLQGTLKHPFAELILNAHIDKKITSNPSCEDGISHFHIACMLNNTKTAEYFLKNGVSVNEPVKINSKVLPGFTPLHFAARYCSLEVAEILLKHGADRYVEDSKGMTPLHILIKYKIEIADGNNMANIQQFPHFNIELNRLEKMISILANDNLNNVSPIDNIKLTHLHIICTQVNHIAEKNFKFQLKNLKAIVKEDSNNWPGYTPLHFAAHFNLEIVLYLVQQGADILAKDAKGVTPLDLCIERYEVRNMFQIFKEDTTLNQIRFTDNSKLVDVISQKFLNSTASQNIDSCISLDSPLWPGYSLMHLAVLFTKFLRNVTLIDLLEKNDQTSIGQLNFLKDQVDLKNISSCLSAYLVNCNNNILQAPDNMTPIHLAFKLKNYSACRELLQGLKEESNFIDNQNLSHFHIACIMNHEEFIMKFLKVKNKKTKKFISMINSRTNHSIEWYIYDEKKFVKRIAAADSTALHFAIMTRNQKLVKLLLEKGADPCIKNKDDHTPVHLSFMENLCESYISGSLLSAACEKLQNPETKEGFSHFHVACCIENRRIVELFLEIGVDINKPISKRVGNINNIANSENLEIVSDENLSEMLKSSYSGFTPLHLAVEKNNLNTVKFLVKNGANIFCESENKSTPLYLACKNRHNEILDFFLSKIKNGNIKYKNVAGFTLLHLACLMVEKKLIEKLLESGFDVNARIVPECSYLSGLTPFGCLMLVDSFKAESLLELLLKYGADVTIKQLRLHGTPVHFANQMISKKSTLMLLENQKDYKINPSDESGITHFHIACSKNNSKIVKQFLKNGVNVDQTNNCFEFIESGLTPLHFAMNKNATLDIVKLLVKHGANVNAKDSSGSTPLHLARKFKHLEVILNTGKADVNLRNIYGKTPLEMIFDRIINESETLKAIELLLSLGSRINSYNPVTDKGLLAICFKKSFNLNMVAVIDAASDISCLDEDEGRNAIQNIVSIENFYENSANRTARLIKHLKSKGCNLNHQDYKGKTALHTSVHFNNVVAIEALLMVGADINIIDKNGKTPYQYCIESTEETVRLLSWHIKKLIALDLYVIESNRLLYKSISSFNFEDYEASCENELIETKIYNFTESFKAYDLLSETFVADYPTMPRLRREFIDSFLATEVYIEFPQLASLMYLQYSKAIDRIPLMEPSKNVIRFMSKRNLPEPCSESILRHLSNNDLKNMISLNVEKLKDQKQRENDPDFSKNSCKLKVKRRKVK